jgi:hypothetical protein
MEKDIHNDRLEDYVKKSFGDFEEIPSGDMWSRIEAVLPAGEPARRLPVLLHAYKWQIAAGSCRFCSLHPDLYSFSHTTNSNCAR